MLRTFGALGLLLGLLAGALWAVKRYDIRLPGRVGGGGRRRVELVERLSIDAKRSVALIRRDGREHLIMMGPDGHSVIETGIDAPAPAEAPHPVASERIRADLARIGGGFGMLVERLESRRKPADPPRRTRQLRPSGVAARAARKVASGA